MDLPVETLTPAPPELEKPAPEAADSTDTDRGAAESASHADASIALERVRAYCEALGLRERQRADDIAQGLVERVMAEHPDDDGRVWMKLAMDALYEQIDAWEEALSQHSGRERHLIAASLPTILRDQSDLFLNPHLLDEPDRLRRAPAGRPTPPLPPSTHCKMPRQRFGKPPAVLRPGFWLRLWRSGQHDEHPIERMIRRKHRDE